jgi:hypothetical protein
MTLRHKPDPAHVKEISRIARESLRAHQAFARDP